MSAIYIWFISILSIAGVIIRPYKIKEPVWPIAGAVLLLIAGLITKYEVWMGIIKGKEVYLFLTGMMLLAETARESGLFSWLAAYATILAKGSPMNLFSIIYVVGILVTIFLSNDATAVVLTPAVATATKTAGIKNPLPYLLICAFIANAASFVLPISNPANLVIYGNNIPALHSWLSQFLVPSIVSITCTYFLLIFLQRKQIIDSVDSNISLHPLTKENRVALIGIIATAIVLTICSSYQISLGLPTFITGILTASIVLVISSKRPALFIKNISWSVIFLVAGLFILVEAINKTGVTALWARTLFNQTRNAVTEGVWITGIITAFGCNLVNNLPAGLLSGNVVQMAHVPEIIRRAILIGIDLGPNLSVTGSLATILWLVALRREQININGWKFLKLGIFIMTITLLLTIASLWLKS